MTDHEQAVERIRARLMDPDDGYNRSDQEDGEDRAGGDLMPISCWIGWHRWLPYVTSHGYDARYCLRCQRSEVRHIRGGRITWRRH